MILGLLKRKIVNQTEPRNLNQATTHNFTPASSNRADLLLPTNEDARILPPRTFANVFKLSLIWLMAGFHSSASGRSIGSTGWSFIMRSALSRRATGGLGMRRRKKPIGIDMKPSASEIPQSRPLILVTWNAFPPTNTISTCAPISNRKVSTGKNTKCARTPHTY